MIFDIHIDLGVGDFGQVPARPIVLYLGAQPNCDDILVMRMMVFGYCTSGLPIVKDTAVWRIEKFLLRAAKLATQLVLVPGCR